MAKQSHDREDLLRDGTAMPIRGRTMIGETEVFLGFRSDGQFSLYWDQDPVFQFDPLQQLRRVYIDGQRLKAEQGRLVAMTKQSSERSSSAERLQFRFDLVSDDRQRHIIERLGRCLQQIDARLGDFLQFPDPDTVQSVGLSPDAFCEKVLAWSQTLPRPVKVAETPASS